jgi:hypothetical protein
MARLQESLNSEAAVARDCATALSIESMEVPAPSFGQQNDSEDHERVGGDGEEGDRMAQSHRRTEVTDERGENGAEGPPETVGETLARAAQAAGEKLGKERADRAEDARSEESERKPQHEHRVIANRPVGVPHNGGERAHGKENERRLAAEAVSKMGAGQVARQRARDYNGEISAGIQNGKVALSLEKGWQPGGDGVVAALSSDRDQGRQCRDAKEIWTENSEKTTCVARDDGLVSLAINLRLPNVSANIENEQRGQNADPEHRSPGDCRRQKREQQCITKRRESPANRPTCLHRAHGLSAMMPHRLSRASTNPESERNALNKASFLFRDTRDKVRLNVEEAHFQSRRMA